MNAPLGGGDKVVLGKALIDRELQPVHPAHQPPDREGSTFRRLDCDGACEPSVQDNHPLARDHRAAGTGHERQTGVSERLRRIELRSQHGQVVRPNFLPPDRSTEPKRSQAEALRRSRIRDQPMPIAVPVRFELGDHDQLRPRQRIGRVSRSKIGEVGHPTRQAPVLTGRGEVFPSTGVTSALVSA